MTIGTVDVRIKGAGKSRFGLFLLEVVARLFHIKLELSEIK